jgi:hypothetical protein
MHSLLSFWLPLGGITNPTLAFGLSLVFVLYQLFTGSLLNLRWAVWVRRKERPGLYWIVIGIEAAICVLGIYIGTL